MKSMTGYGGANVESRMVRYQWEIKSVNHRYLNVKVRLPKELNYLEQDIQREIGKRITRGSVDVRLTAERLEDRPAEITVDQAALEQIVALYEEIRVGCKSEMPIDPNRLLANRDWIVRETTPEAEEEWPCIQRGLGEAIGALLEMRKQEGVALKSDLTARLERLGEEAAEVARLHEEARAERGQKLKESIERTIALLDAKGTELDPGRLEAETVMLIDRMDIAEENTRLASHIRHFGELMEAEGPAGKKLDFLIQEMNREINTIGSKSPNAEIGQRVVAMKSGLEQIREQIQNIE